MSLLDMFAKLTLSGLFLCVISFIIGGALSAIDALDDIIAVCLGAVLAAGLVFVVLGGLGAGLTAIWTLL